MIEKLPANQLPRPTGRMKTALIVGRIAFLVGFLSLLQPTTTAAFSSSSPANIAREALAMVMTSSAFSEFGPPEPPVAIFSDVDGTLVHYPEGNDKSFLLDNIGKAITIGKNNKILQLPASATGLQGVISSQTLAKCQEIRNSGSKLVLVSGMRTSTLLKRLPFLPLSDAYCNEGGGRIFYRVPLSEDVPKEDWPSFVVHPEVYDGATEEDLQPFALQEDMAWRQQMEQSDAAGTDGYIGVELPPQESSGDNNDPIRHVPLSDRVGALWDYAQDLSSQGFVLDTNGYATCFRVNRKQQITPESKDSFERLLAGSVTCPPGISTSTNLGCVDFYPEDSGKNNCCRYLANKFSDGGDPDALSKRCVCLCDDDNDSEMALACHHAFIPGVGSASMKRLIQKYPAQFSRTGEDRQTIAEGLVATEHALELVLERATDCGSRDMEVEECVLRIDDARNALKEY